MSADTRCVDCPQFSNGIFASLSKEERYRSLCVFEISSYTRRQPVYSEGQSADLVFLVKTGLIKSYRSFISGRSQILNITGPGEILGIEAVFNANYSSSAESLVRSELCYCKGYQFGELLERYPLVSLRVIDMMHHDIVRTHAFLCEIGTKKAFARVASCLLFLRDKQGEKLSNTFQLPIMRNEMSWLLGVSPETISRQLKRLMKEGLIEIENKRVTINDLEKLSTIARQP